MAQKLSPPYAILATKHGSQVRTFLNYQMTNALENLLIVN